MKLVPRFEKAFAKINFVTVSSFASPLLVETRSHRRSAVGGSQGGRSTLVFWGGQRRTGPIFENCPCEERRIYIYIYPLQNLEEPREDHGRTCQWGRLAFGLASTDSTSQCLWSPINAGSIYISRPISHTYLSYWPRGTSWNSKSNPLREVANAYVKWY